MSRFLCFASLAAAVGLFGCIHEQANLELDGQMFTSAWDSDRDAAPRGPLDLSVEMTNSIEKKLPAQL